MSDFDPGTPYSYARSDEISLRDLYLILKRGLLWIVVAGLLAGVAAYAIVTVQPDRFRANATVRVAPSPIRVGGDGSLSLAPSDDLSFDSYQTIASTPAVVQAVLEEVGAGVSANRFNSAATLIQVTGPTRTEPGTPLIVTHSVTLGDGVLAARLANSWAEQTRRLFGESLATSLDPLGASSGEASRRLLDELDAAESALEAFESGDTSALITERILGLAERINATEERLATIDRQIAAGDARIAFLSEELEALAGGSAGDALRRLRLLESEGVVPAELTGAIAFLLEERPPDADLEVDVMTLIGSAQLQQLVTDLAGLDAERASVETQLGELEAQGRALQAELAGLNRQRTRLTREVENATASYQAVAELEPLIEVVAELSSAGGRLLSEASPPPGPVPERRLLIAATAALIGAALATLVVFLRAAIDRDTPAVRREDVVGDATEPA